MAALAQDCRGHGLPVTADIETGYAGRGGAYRRQPAAGDHPAVLEAGAVGMNIEDSGGEPLTDVDEQCRRRIAGPGDRRRAPACDLFINARTDTYLSGQLSGTAPSRKRCSRAEATSPPAPTESLCPA